jgi:hypothetical protein
MGTTTTAPAAAALATRWESAFTRAGITTSAATPTPAAQKDAPQPTPTIAARWAAAFRRAGIG